MNKKTLSILICFFFIYIFFKGAIVELEANEINLPKTIGAWTRPDSAQIIDSTNIFKYMNGAGELYLSYGFNHLEVYEYTADNQKNILVELYHMNKQGLITRRDFLRGTIGATLATSMYGVTWAMADEKAVRSSLVTVVRDKNVMDADFAVDFNVYQKMLDQTMIQFTGKNNSKDAWSSIIKPEDTVGLVSTGHLNPTHDELVYAVKIALMDIGVPKKKIKMAQGGSRKARACTALIALPALKAHWLTGIGTVLKNYIMYSDSPSSYHDENSSKLGEIWNLPHVKGKTKLILVDALYPLCDKGPQPDPRYKWAYNGLIAGTDPVAVETVCLKIITEKRKALRGEPWPLSPPPICIEAADKVYGLGTSRVEEIKIEHYGWEQDLLL